MYSHDNVYVLSDEVIFHIIHHFRIAHTPAAALPPKKKKINKKSYMNPLSSIWLLLFTLLYTIIQIQIWDL